MRFRIALAAIALLVFGMSGVASAQATGNLVFVHGIPDGPPVILVIYPDQGATALPDIPVAPGTTTPAIPLPPGTHDVGVYVVTAEGESLLGEFPFTIAAGATTTISAYVVDQEVDVTVVGPVPAPTPTPTPTPTATPRPQTVTVPTRVETGAGGAADGALELVLGGLAAAVAVGALTLGLRRRTTA